MTLDLQALREAAEKATPGPYFVRAGERYDGLWTIEDGRSGGLFPIIAEAPEATYIAAMDPTTTLALLDEVERLRKREASLYDLLNRCERDVQRALRVSNGECSPMEEYEAFRGACEAIQNRAAGVGAPRETSA